MGRKESNQTNKQANKQTNKQTKVSNNFKIVCKRSKKKSPFDVPKIVAFSGHAIDTVIIGFLV